MSSEKDKSGRTTLASSTTATTESILHIFEEMGLRNTRPRRLIAEQLAALAVNGEDFTTDDLWHELRQADPQLGRATVFRAVEVLMQRGMLDRVTFADGSHRYRLCGEHPHHHHITCTECRRVVEVGACLPPEMLAAVEQATGFSLEGHEVELFGRCAECRTHRE